MERHNIGYCTYDMAEQITEEVMARHPGVDLIFTTRAVGYFGIQATGCSCLTAVEIFDDVKQYLS